MVSISTLNQHSEERLSVEYIHKQLAKGYLGYDLQTERWTNIEHPDHLSYLKKHQLNSAYSEKCVLVGQLINLEVLHKIIHSTFASAKHIVVSAHHLHGEFSQQAIVLELFHASLQVNSHAADRETADQVEVNSKQYAGSLISSEVLLDLSRQYFVDCFKVTNISLSTPGLIVMDMDSTIINMECIDEIAALAGVGDKVSKLTERAMQGELDFNQSLHARLSCLTGVKVTELENIKSRLPINPGFAATMACLQNKGWITCIASGGFTYFADYLKDAFELTYAYSNMLSIDNGSLTGEVHGDIVDAEMKQQILLNTREQHSIDPQQTIAIGDGANDLLMMQAAALGVAYKAKMKVQLAADANIQYCGFEGLLYCLKP